MKTPAWWWRAFFFGVAVVVMARRIVPGLIVWPESVPDRSRPPLLLFVGIVLGAAVQGIYQAVRWAVRKRGGVS